MRKHLLFQSKRQRIRHVTRRHSSGEIMPLPNDCLGEKDTLVEEETSAVGAVWELTLSSL